MTPEQWLSLEVGDIIRERCNGRERVVLELKRVPGHRGRMRTSVKVPSIKTVGKIVIWFSIEDVGGERFELVRRRESNTMIMTDEWTPDRTGWARFSADRRMRYRLARALTALTAGSLLQRGVREDERRGRRIANERLHLGLRRWIGSGRQRNVAEPAEVIAFLDRSLCIARDADTVEQRRVDFRREESALRRQQPKRRAPQRQR